MSSAAAAPAAEEPPKKGKKKLILILAIVLVLVLVGGGAAVFMMKKKAAAAEGDGSADGGEAAQAEEHHAPKREKKKEDPHAKPVFLPLDPFVVNLADRDADRYAQVGITLQLADDKATDEVKAYLPAIRNNILLLISHKTADELMTPDGKEKLAHQILIQSVLPMGIELEDEYADEESAAASDGGGNGGKRKRKRHYDSIDDSPVTAVQFSSFIIQ
jgi:flagellar protein FliL